ncbi:sensor histidine kinase [Cohnella caldifontis]|uniref:sensor histidine kinase n=1 Tax=Cohnella caldifontis TaxID=3027471 RepID=UPI0023EC723F|nr:HAMP domain-containing sensor histidine kinase [Cohnella sp. YIM B05605]
MSKLAVFSVKLLFAVILMKDRKDEVKLWSAVCLFCASLFEVTEYIHTKLLPFMKDRGWSTGAEAVRIGRLILFFVQETGIPYAFLMAAIAYSGFFSERTRMRMGLWLLLPPACTVFSLRGGALNLDDPYFLAWTPLYLVVSSALMTAGAFGKRQNRPKNKKIAEALIIIPNILALLVFHYASEIVENWAEWSDTILLIVIATFVLFLVVISRSGILGIKLRLERQVVMSTFRSVTSGTALLHHSIKNRLTNIDLLAKQILEQPGMAANGTVREDVAQIHAETRRVLETILHIQQRTESILLNEQVCRLGEIVQDAVNACALYRSEKKANVRMEMPDDAAIFGDRSHLRETIVNLLHNALDALPEKGGEIRIAAEPAGKGMALEVRDNGAGIAAEQLGKIMEPFYTTKDRSDNFGLGLTYCYLVVEKHNGSLQISSRPGEGTAVRILFPPRRIVSELRIQERESRNAARTI